ncbi:MAG: DUF3822 family protein [Cryomorphaceae bacterium]|nr:DUF3822 family protein [Cryomorphaceae bacterium]
MVTGNKEKVDIQGLSPDHYSSDHFLYALVADDSLLWAVTNAYKSVLSIGDLRFEPSERISKLNSWTSNTLRNTTFASTSIALRSCDMVLVPNALYDFKRSPELLQLSSGVEYQNCLSFNISRLSATLIYGVDEEVLGFFQGVFRGQKLVPSQGLLIDALLKHNRFDRNTQIVVDVHGRKCDFAVVGHSKLFLANSFNFKTDEDILFYTANIVKQLALENEEISIEACGEVTDQQLELFREYFESVTRFEGYDQPPVDAAIDANSRHTTLLNIIACAS